MKITSETKLADIKKEGGTPVFTAEEIAGLNGKSLSSFIFDAITQNSDGEFASIHYGMSQGRLDQLLGEIEKIDPGFVGNVRRLAASFKPSSSSRITTRKR